MHLSNSRILTTWAMAIAGALGIVGIIYEQLNASLTSDQQTVVTSTTRVVVVLIPGFPIESIALGTVLGLIMLTIIRRRRQRRTHQSDWSFDVRDQSLSTQDRLSEEGFP